MSKFIGVKMVEATPMTRGEFTELKKAEISPATNPEEKGYMVVYEDGYKSWSPEKAFEKSYSEMHDMEFGEAIRMMKRGYRMARKGWNGKGMFVVYQKGYPEGIPCNRNTAEAFGYDEGDIFICRPYLQMRCADGTHQMWVASQSDILAEDWYIV